jgi:arsenite methyltransferase
MEPIQEHEIRQAVRDRYGQIARRGREAGGRDQVASSRPAARCGGGCCGRFQTKQDELFSIIGYAPTDLEAVVPGANLGLGCCNPVALASLHAGQTVLDLGSGGGFDCFLAARAVGPAGRVIGVDMTPDMIDLARSNAVKMGATNVEFHLGEIERLPVADASVDVVMSNCVINLSPDKAAVFQEVWRVLRTGGRLAIADILATEPLPEALRQDLALVSACVGGAVTIDQARRMLEGIGFQEVRITAHGLNQDWVEAWSPGRRAGEYVVSAYIEAIKPEV